MTRILLGLALAAAVCGLASPSRAQDGAVEVSAVCMDAQGEPHPAAQTFGQAETAADFEGELFRCLPGTHLRYDAGHVVSDCAAGEALWFGSGALACRAALARTREEERELLRQFGAGVKRVHLAAPPEAAPPQRPAYPRYQ